MFILSDFKEEKRNKRTNDESIYWSYTHIGFTHGSFLSMSNMLIVVHVAFSVESFVINGFQ